MGTSSYSSRLCGEVIAMSVVEQIKQAWNIHEIIKALGAEHIKGSGELRCCCPLHRGDNPTAFVINEYTGVFYCHTNCGGGDVIDLVMEIEELPFKQAVKWIADMFGVAIDWETAVIEEDAFRKDARKFIEQMMKRNKQTQLPAFKIQNMKFAKVNEYRGYSPETLAWWKMRYCTEGELKDRIVMALEDVDKRLVGITGRATKTEQVEKFMHRPRNLHTGYFLTGLGRNIKYVQEANNTAKIVEGLFDCARWYDCGHRNVCCPIGVFFTEEHILQLYKAGVTTLEIGFDGDKAGRNGFRKAYKKAVGKFEVYYLDYPEGKDADDCTKEELDQVVKNRLTYWEFCEKYGEEIEK